MSREVAFCVFTTHTVSRGDQTPCRLISDAQLKYYRRCEVATSALGGIVVGAVLILIVCALR